MLRFCGKTSQLMRNHTHRHFDFGLLPVCATYDHRKLSNPFSCSFCVRKDGESLEMDWGEGDKVV